MSVRDIVQTGRGPCPGPYWGLQAMPRGCARPVTLRDDGRHNHPMSALNLLEAHRNEIVDLCRRFCVSRLLVFGSALTDQWDDDRSDFDFLVDYSPDSRSLPPLDRLVGLQLALEDLLGHKVDVVNRAAARNQHFLQSAEEHSRELYAA